MEEIDYLYKRYSLATRYREGKATFHSVERPQVYTVGRKTYTFNSITGEFSTPYPETIYTGDYYGYVYLSTTIGRPNNALLRKQGGSSGGDEPGISTYIIMAEPYSIQGAYIDEVIGGENQYPINGVSGSYWYVRGNIAESANIIKPTVGEVVSKGYTIEWEKTHPDILVQLDLSIDGGNTWNTIASNETENSIQFDFSYVGATDKARLRIRTILGNSYSSWNVMEGNFAIRSFPELFIKVDNQIKTAEAGWVKVGGVLKEIESITVKVDGNLREV